MKLTREQALELHRRMWTDMQKDLGDNPTYEQRYTYKARWLRTNFPHDCVACNCFLCEYAKVPYEECEDYCPIEWPAGRCEDGSWYDEESAKWDYSDNWTHMPISRLLALPERKIEE